MTRLYDAGEHIPWWDEDQDECRRCSDYHPTGVLEDGYCPSCVDEDEDGSDCFCCDYGTCK